MENSITYQGNLTGALDNACMLLLNLIMLQKSTLSSGADYPTDFGLQLEGPNLEETLAKFKFDFVIVGAGAAGCVLANKLTEHKAWNVLLIEAGKNPSSTTDVPGFYSGLPGGRQDWHFVTQTDENACQGMVEKVCRVPKGKTVGGSSSTNNLHYTRGFPRDFEVWTDSGNPNWDAESVELSYEQLENYGGHRQFSIKYGTKGSLVLDNFESGSSVKDLIYEGARALDYGKIPENNSLGYTENLVNVVDGKRQNMAKAFLKPIKSRANFFLLKNTYVTKLLIPNPKEKRVKGVECLMGDRLFKIMAKREVVLSAGALNTPKIMMLSGIGPFDHLKEFEIPPVANLKVGENLQEHLGVPIFVALGDKIDGNASDPSRELVDGVYLYMMHAKGPLTTTNINDLVGFINTRNDPYEIPNMAVYHNHHVPRDLHLEAFLESTGYEEAIKKSILNRNYNQTLVMFVPTILKPKSRGVVRLNKADPLALPKIIGNFLSDEHDVKCLMSGFKYVEGLVETKAFKELNAKVVHVDVPACRNFKFCTDAFIKCYLASMAYPQGDVVGTARMGPSCNSESVVGENLLVHGVRGLRIVDASAMPEIVSGNIPATAAMMANKVSETIKVKWIPDYVPAPTNTC